MGKQFKPLERMVNFPINLLYNHQPKERKREREM